MEPITLSVDDSNIIYKINRNENNNRLDDSTDNIDPNGNAHIMFPTNIKYIFDDEIDEPSHFDSIMNIDSHDEIENVIVIKIDESYRLEDVELISENFELLSFNKDNLSNTFDKMKDQGSDSTDHMGIELEVVSKFNDIGSMVDDLSLDELINLYTIQSEQIKKISNSI